MAAYLRKFVLHTNDFKVMESLLLIWDAVTGRKNKTIVMLTSV